MNLKELVKKIQGAVKDIDNLNRGGCGVFAALVAKRLNRIGIPAVVRIGDDSAYDEPDLLIQSVTNNSRFSKDVLYSNGVRFDHLIVEIDHGGRKYHLDSDYFHLARPITKNCDAKLYNGYLTPYQALLVAKGKDGWNRTFNRKQIPKMIKKLNEVFN